MKYLSIFTLVAFVIIFTLVAFKDHENDNKNDHKSYDSFNFTSRYLNGMQYIIITSDNSNNVMEVINVTKDRTETDAALKIKNSK